MKLLTEQLRNGRVSIEDAVLQAIGLTSDPAVQAFLHEVPRRIKESNEIAIQEAREKWDENTGKELDDAYNDGVMEAHDLCELEDVGEDVLKKISALQK